METSGAATTQGHAVDEGLVDALRNLVHFGDL
jgi:hypothetical protein